MIDNQYSYYQMYSVGGIENIGPGYGFKCKSLGNRKRMPRDFFYYLKNFDYFCRLF